jgi:Kef-type K+ transport system membrane component KefB
MERRNRMLDDTVLTRSLGIIVIVGAIFALAARPVKIPTIVAYLLAGLVLGPLTGLVVVSENLDLISHVGVALLLFLVGLELSFDRVRDVGRVVVVAGVAQMALTAAGGYLIAHALGFGMAESLVLAAATTFSSTVIVVKLLGEQGELGLRYGRLAIGIFLIQDLVAVLLLTFLAGFESNGAATPVAIATEMIRAFGGVIVLFVLALVASRHLLPRPFAWVARSPDTLFIASLSWCFLLAVGGEWMGLSLEIGAFLAGIALAQLPFNQELHRRVHPLMNFFIAVFFITQGVRMEVNPAAVNWIAAIALSLLVLLMKPLLLVPIISRMGSSLRTSFLTGISVAQISEFSLLLVALAVSARLADEEVLSITALVGLITFAASAYMIRYGSWLYGMTRASGLFRLIGPRIASEDEAAPEPRGGHVIVIGMNTLGREIATRLHERGESVLAIDRDLSRLQNLPFDTIQGSVEYLSLLLEAGLPSAKLVVSALSTEETNDLLAYRCRSYDVPCSIHTIDLSVIDNLFSANATYLMIPKVDGIKLQARELRRLGFLK